VEKLALRGKAPQDFLVSPSPPDDLTVTIRAATRADLEALGELGAELMRVHYAFDRARFMEPRGDAAAGYAWFLGSELDDPRAVVLVADRGDRIVGYTYAGLEPQSWKELRDPAGFIHDVVVAESARGRGIATLLVEAAAHWLEQHGAPRVLLWSAELNGAAQRLFARLGFRRTMIEMTREAGVTTPAAPPPPAPPPREN
jgi:ribosomal protein S18 acetylase RimI-like enzyme